MKCSQTTCEKPAEWSYVWPGRPDRMLACSDHLRAAINISGAMGFAIGDVQPTEHEGTTAPEDADRRGG